MKYQLLPPLSDDDRAALEASIVAHGRLGRFDHRDGRRHDRDRRRFVHDDP